MYIHELCMTALVSVSEVKISSQQEAHVSHCSHEEQCQTILSESSQVIKYFDPNPFLILHDFIKVMFEQIYLLYEMFTLFFQ